MTTHYINTPFTYNPPKSQTPKLYPHQQPLIESIFSRITNTEPHYQPNTVILDSLAGLPQSNPCNEVTLSEWSTKPTTNTQDTDWQWKHQLNEQLSLHKESPTDFQQLRKTIENGYNNPPHFSFGGQITFHTPQRNPLPNNLNYTYKPNCPTKRCQDLKAIVLKETNPNHDPVVLSFDNETEQLLSIHVAQKQASPPEPHPAVQDAPSWEVCPAPSLTHLKLPKLHKTNTDEEWQNAVYPNDTVPALPVGHIHYINSGIGTGKSQLAQHFLNAYEPSSISKLRMMPTQQPNFWYEKLTAAEQKIFKEKYAQHPPIIANTKF